eukprot:6213294-Pleurochrysis_carterae.AAC.1
MALRGAASMRCCLAAPLVPSRQAVFARLQTGFIGADETSSIAHTMIFTPSLSSAVGAGSSDGHRQLRVSADSGGLTSAGSGGPGAGLDLGWILDTLCFSTLFRWFSRWLGHYGGRKTLRPSGRRTAAACMQERLNQRGRNLAK